METPQQLTIPSSTFSRALRILAAERGSWFELPAGHYWHSGNATLEVLAARHPTPLNEVIRLRLASSFPRFPDQFLPPECRALLLLGDGPLCGRATGWVRTNASRWES